MFRKIALVAAIAATLAIPATELSARGGGGGGHGSGAGGHGGAGSGYGRGGGGGHGTIRNAPLFERYRAECIAQYAYLRGPGRVEIVRSHVRDCIIAKMQARALEHTARRAGAAS
jgi:hypothetical protein